MQKKLTQLGEFKDEKEADSYIRRSMSRENHGSRKNEKVL